MKKTLVNLFAAGLLVLPLAALAHTGHGEHGFVAGLTHPFLGLDHLLAMLAVGLWSVLHMRRVWLAPAAFVAFLAIGALLGQNGIVVPQLEPLVAASVVVLGLMLALAFNPGTPAALSVVAAFALCHGMAHGGELSVGGAVLAGIVLGSALLHASGMAIAHFGLKRRPQLVHRLGQIMAFVGGGLVLAAVM